MQRSQLKPMDVQRLLHRLAAHSHRVIAFFWGTAFAVTIILGLLCESVLNPGYETYRCIQDLSEWPPAESRVLIFGSSRVREAINPDQLGKELGFLPGQVLNLAMSGNANDVQFLLLRKFLQQGKKIEAVVVELSVPSENDAVGTDETIMRLRPAVGFARSPIAPLFEDELDAGPEDVGISPVLMLHERVTRRLQVGFLSAYSLLWRLKHFVLQDLQNLSVEKSTTGTRCNAAHSEKNLFATYTDKDIDRGSDIFNRDYAANDLKLYIKLIDLVRNHRVKLIFVRVPDRISPPDTNAFAQEFRARTTATVVLPPLALVERLRAHSYYDNSHMTDGGEIIFTSWLASEVLTSGLFQKP
jgi:hypothetical protein